jgi:WhiB family redox-sensing transcriptional regulator
MDDAMYWRAIAEIDGTTLEALDALLVRPAWHAQAACRGQGPDTWFIGQGGDPEPARQICAACPVREPCAQAGRDEQHGVWAGVSARGRRAARRTAA